MSTSNYDVCVHFAKRQSKKLKRGYSVFTDYDNSEIYSYGTHFPMAYADDDRKLIILNGDRYSVTTSHHQSTLRGTLATYLPKDYHLITVPFSVARAAHIDVRTIEQIDVESDSEYAYCETHNETFYGSSTTTAYQDLVEHRALIYSLNQEHCKTRYEHHLGGSVFRAKGDYYNEPSKFKYFLSGFDDTHNSRTDGYFISQLPKRVKSVHEGYESLKPPQVVKAIAEGLEVKRQGDCFAIPVPNLKTRKMIKFKSKRVPIIRETWVREKNENGEILPYPAGSYQRVVVGNEIEIPTFGNNSHGANEVAFGSRGEIYARGSLIHRPLNRFPEHKRIPLGKIWHKIYKNTAIASWQSQTGRVD